jgi:acyl-CoA thioesterase-1
MSTRRNFIKKSTALGLAVSAIPGIAWSQRVGSQPKVLILGDSISIGYYPLVKDLMKGKADVMRPFKANKSAENCQGTTYGIQHIDRWIGNTKWDVIHFNFGLHDLKHVDPMTGKNSDSAKDPRQAEPKKYKRNLKIITKKLLDTKAKLIYATTTPYPKEVGGPVRVYGDAEKYNKMAKKIMKKYDIPVNDLYSFVLPQMTELQRTNNVHFSKKGNRALAEEVVKQISAYI